MREKCLFFSRIFFQSHTSKQVLEFVKMLLKKQENEKSL